MKLITTVIISAALVGCATYRPVVDTKNVDMAQYEQDLLECQSYANQVSPAGNAVAGAAIGAIFGAALGAIIGNSSIAGQGAAMGGLYGAGGAAGAGAAKQQAIIMRCLSGRGYQVLG